MIPFIKHLAGALATPPVIAILIALVGGLCVWRGRRRAARWWFASSVAILYLGSIGPVANALLAPLETQYPPLNDERPLPDVTAIVVLGSSYAPRGGIPVTAALEDDGLARIVEGVRLAKRFPGMRLLVSGGALPGETPSAFGYAKLARQLGVPDASVVVLADSLDTGDEARTVSKLLGHKRFLLVTTASHMPRAMRLMQRAGAEPIAAATGQRVSAPNVYSWRSFVPGSESLRRIERALHEYLGLAALAIGVD